VGFSSEVRRDAEMIAKDFVERRHYLIYPWGGLTWEGEKMRVEWSCAVTVDVAVKAPRKLWIDGLYSPDLRLGQLLKGR